MRIKTGFFMRDFKNSPEPSLVMWFGRASCRADGSGRVARFVGALLLAALVAALPPTARANDAESVRVANPTLVMTPAQSWSLEADVSVALSAPLIDAVKRGVPLHFVAEFELLRHRWYWFDEKLASHSRVVRLMYHAVTQHYWVTVGGGHPQTYPQLEQALLAATQLRDWDLPESVDSVLVAHAKELKKTPERFELRLRVRLDTAQLPKPLQMNALTNRDWNLSSDWVVPKLKVDTSAAPPQGTGRPE